ncbi:NADAR family protein [Pseudoxanthomonas sp. LjRoot125]|uniref:NADAR family protein n=1 Tax=Pseudoxanthomonas sp. LjRoot125 TaxID=3342258 RepID=UPI003E118684
MTKKTAKPPKTAKAMKPRSAQAAQAVDEVRFYRSNEKPYGVFSNLFRSEVEFEGLVYPTAEHAYQAGKARKEVVRDWILAAPTPALAAMAAHGLYVWDVKPDWAKTKFDRMRGVLRAKFTQHPKLAELLLSTGSARLVEVGTVDNAVNRLWGEVNGVGKNMLGVLLMEVRAEILAAQQNPKPASVKKASRTPKKAPARREAALEAA